MRLRCTGCKTWLCDDEELNDDGDDVPIEMAHKGGGTWAITEIVHTPERCAATRNDRAARVEKAAVDLLGALAQEALLSGHRIPIQEQREIRMHRDEAIAALRAAIERLVEAGQATEQGLRMFDAMARDALPALSALAGCCVLDVEVVRVLADAVRHPDQHLLGCSLTYNEHMVVVPCDCTHRVDAALAAAEAELASVERR